MKIKRVEWYIKVVTPVFLSGAENSVKNAKNILSLEGFSETDEEINSEIKEKLEKYDYSKRILYHNVNNYWRNT